MNIEALNSNKKIKITNPISIENKHNPSFTGHVLTQDEHGNDVYKFNLPNAPQGAKVELAVMVKDKNGDFRAAQKLLTKDVPAGFNSVSVTASEMNLDKDSLVGYRFLVNGEQKFDNGVQGGVVGNKFVLATPAWRSNPSLPRQAEHILIDSFNIETFAKKTKRNHFNVLGGTLNSVNEKLDELEKFGVRSILGTPIFGQDNKSSHGYWTTNPYQITNNLGDKKDFTKLMVDMYKRGMSWTADGAFVTEGLEGVHLKDMTNWGKDSVFLPMFATTNIGNEPFKFGILSKQEDVSKHTHIKLVNAPYQITYEKTADGYKEKEVKHKSYDPTKPTYIQVFDDRLASEKQVNGDEIFDVYDNKDSGDNFEIANYKDSVQAYHYRVTPNAVKANYEKYKEIKSKTHGEVEFKNLLTSWPNFEITVSNKDSGIALWNGNSDITKKRFFTPESEYSNKKYTPEQQALIKAAQYQVQDDTIQVGKFWTGEVARALTEYTARELSSKVEEGKTYEQAIKELINEKKLSKDALKVTIKGSDGSPLSNILDRDDFDERGFKLKPIKTAKSLTDGMMSLPFDSIEFSPDLVSVLSYPFIKNLSVSQDTIGMSRYDMYQMGDKYYNKMPEKYRKLYKQMDTVIASSMKNQANSIMLELENKMGISLYEKEGILNQQGKEIYTLIAPDIAKFLVVSALAPKIKPKDNSEMLEYDTKELGKIDLNYLNLQHFNSPDAVAQSLIKKIEYGIDNLSEDKREAFIKHLYKRIKNVDSDSVNVARLIIEQTEAGMGWRIDAAKDIGDWESVDVKQFDREKNENLILQFWSDFNKGIREHNPRSVTIGELTDWSVAPSQFSIKGGFTAISDYLFPSNLIGYFGQNTDGKHIDNIASETEKLLNAYFGNGFSENLNFVHRFVGNQDLPRVLHNLTMDMGKFNADKGKAMGDTLQRGLFKADEFNKLDDSKKQAILNALKMLVGGQYMYKGEKREYNNENFGFRPFNYNIDSLIEQTEIISPEFKNYSESHPKEIEKLKANALKGILEPALEKYRAMVLMMTALPGNPTIYAGDEFGTTGWEWFTKNETQENRNPVRWDWLNDDNYKFVADFRERIGALMRIRNKEGASPLVNGTLVHLNPQTLNEGGTAGAIFRYNDKSDAIAVFHNKGYTSSEHSKGENAHISKIDLGGLPNGLCVGTMYVNALNSDEKYKVTSQYAIERVDGNGNRCGDIDLGNAGLILLRQNDYNNKPMSFKRRMENPNVKLANTKFNLAGLGAR